jgi:hypothetical protein
LHHIHALAGIALVEDDAARREIDARAGFFREQPHIDVAAAHRFVPLIP